jgi:glucan 1,3-beta-glucosidase
VTIGSEGLYRKSYTADFLVGKLNDMRSAAPGLKYGTADTWNRFADGTADPVLQVSDVALVNAFSYWQGANIDAAAGVFQDSTGQAFDHINSVKGDRDIMLWVGETGWPSRGTTYQNAVPTVENSDTFYRQAVCGSLGSGTNVFVFEAFDEPWKPQSVGEDGSSADETSWGVMTADRQKKYNLNC